MNGLRLAFVGDLSFGFLQRYAVAASAWPAMRGLIDAVGPLDGLIGNLECCLVDGRCSAKAREQSMAAPPAVAAALAETGFSALCLANNHMLDCGPEAITATREALWQAGIAPFGAGLDLARAEKTLFEAKRGHRIAYLGACDYAGYYASHRNPGIAPLAKNRLGGRVRAAAARADMVVVCLHADLEFCPVPAPWRQRLSRWLIAQGAHLVIQHHPHVLQGIESYRGGLIAYSLGNFVFPLKGNAYQQHRPGVFDSVVLVVEARFENARPKLSHRVVPARIGDDHFPHRLPAGESERLLAALGRRSAWVGDTALHRRLWLRRCQEEAALRTGLIYYACRRAQPSRAARDVLSLLKNRQERRWLQSLLTLGYF